MAQHYRPEIDGLRALAILPVILYHGGASLVPGGFVGVDIFFVLSGYLITRILLSDAAAGGISIARFYERRARRILPALVAVLLFVVIAGWFVLLPGDYENLGEALLASIFWVANWHFRDELDYFAPAAEHQPLLHLWSLGVEEQFYLFFPLLLIGVLRFWPQRVLAILMGLAAVSLLASIDAVWAGKTKTAFFATQLRAWELLAGACLAAAPALSLPNWSGRLLALAGAILLAAALFGISATTAFPGAAALLPVIGTVCLLLATEIEPMGRAARLLGWAPLRAIGLISYSWYLWHWPMLVLFRMSQTFPPSEAQLLLVAGLSLIPAALSWRFVERPFRQKGDAEASPKYPLFVAGGVTLAMALIAAALDASKGMPQRLPQDARLALEATRDVSRLEKCTGADRIDWAVEARTCRLGAGADGPPRFLVWGDSHGQALAPAFDTAARLAGTTGLMVARGGCPPLLGVNQRREGFDDCTERYEGLIEAIAAAPALDQVFLAARWAIYADGTRYRREAGPPVLLSGAAGSGADNAAIVATGLARTVAALRDTGVTVHFVAQVPEAEASVPKSVARSKWRGAPYALDPTRQAYSARQANVLAAIEALPQPLSVIDTWAHLCDADPCPLVREGVPIYRDGNHLTETAARALGPAFSDYLQPLK